MTERSAPAASGPTGPTGSSIPMEGSTQQAMDIWGNLNSELLMFPVTVADWPVQLGKTRQLFLDDYLVARREGLRRVVHQPEKHPANPVMAGETAMEGGANYGPVLAHILHDDASGRFRLWYRSRIAYEAGGRKYSNPNLYAESSDGIHWERPDLNLYPWDGPGPNNMILPAGDLRGLIHEPHDTAAPWKAIWEHNSLLRSPDWVKQEGYHLYTSPDGLHWTYGRNLVPYSGRVAYRGPHGCLTAHPPGRYRPHSLG